MPLFSILTMHTNLKTVQYLLITIHFYYIHSDHARNQTQTNYDDDDDDDDDDVNDDDLVCVEILIY